MLGKGRSNTLSLKILRFSWVLPQAGILIKTGICLTGGAISQLCISRSSLSAWSISTGTTRGSSLEDKTWVKPTVSTTLHLRLRIFSPFSSTAFTFSLSFLCPRTKSLLAPVADTAVSVTYSSSWCPGRLLSLTAAKVTDGSLQVSGISTLGENIADNGGVRQAYKVTVKWSVRWLYPGDLALVLPVLSQEIWQLMCHYRIQNQKAPLYLYISRSFCCHRSSHRAGLLAASHPGEEHLILLPYSDVLLCLMLCSSVSGKPGPWAWTGTALARKKVQRPIS